MSEVLSLSQARTNKLKCSDCSEKINQGDMVIFRLDYESYKPMKKVYCKSCKEHYTIELCDQRHPRDLED